MILVTELIGFCCYVALCFTAHPAPLVLSMCVKCLGMIVKMFDGPPGTRDITTVLVTNGCDRTLQIGVYDGTDNLCLVAEKVVRLQPNQSTYLAARAFIDHNVKKVYVRLWSNTGARLRLELTEGQKSYRIEGNESRLTPM